MPSIRETDGADDVQVIVHALRRQLGSQEQGQAGTQYVRLEPYLLNLDASVANSSIGIAIQVSACAAPPGANDRGIPAAVFSSGAS